MTTICKTSPTYTFVRNSYILWASSGFHKVFHLWGLSSKTLLIWRIFFKPSLSLMKLKRSPKFTMRWPSLSSCLQSFMIVDPGANFNLHFRAHFGILLQGTQYIQVNTTKLRNYNIIIIKRVWNVILKYLLEVKKQKAHLMQLLQVLQIRGHWQSSWSIKIEFDHQIKFN